MEGTEIMLSEKLFQAEVSCKMSTTLSLFALLPYTDGLPAGKVQPRLLTGLASLYDF